jgi:hypothetical protein
MKKRKLKAIAIERGVGDKSQCRLCRGVGNDAWHDHWYRVDNLGSTYHLCVAHLSSLLRVP